MGMFGMLSPLPPPVPGATEGELRDYSFRRERWLATERRFRIAEMALIIMVGVCWLVAVPAFAFLLTTL